MARCLRLSVFRSRSGVCLGKLHTNRSGKGGKLESLNEQDSAFLTYCNWKPSAAQSLDSGNRIPAPGNNTQPVAPGYK